MDGLERVHHVKTMHVHNGGIDAQLVTETKGRRKHTFKRHTLQLVDGPTKTNRKKKNRGNNKFLFFIFKMEDVINQ